MRSEKERTDTRITAVRKKTLTEVRDGCGRVPEYSDLQLHRFLLLLPPFFQREHALRVALPAVPPAPLSMPHQTLSPNSPRKPIRGEK